MAQGLLKEDVIMTKKCGRLKNLNEEDGELIALFEAKRESGGCSGFQYIFDFDDEAPRRGTLFFSR